MNVHVTSEELVFEKQITVADFFPFCFFFFFFYSRPPRRRTSPQCESMSITTKLRETMLPRNILSVLVEVMFATDKDVAKWVCVCVFVCVCVHMYTSFCATLWQKAD